MTVKIEAAVVGAVIREVPITRTPDEPREIGVPDTVMAAPPGVKVVLPIATAVGLAVKAWPPAVKTE